MEDIIKLLEELVKFETDALHQKEIEKCFTFVEKYLSQRNLEVKRYLINNKPSLVAAKKIKKHYQYILNGHLDVVPGDYTDAFLPKIVGSRMYGRGTADMKGTTAAMMVLMSNLTVASTSPDIAIMLTADEEIGGMNGTRYLIQEEGYTCECAIIPDGGNNFHLTIAQKGILHIKITVKGKTAHGSRPWLGNNAIDIGILIYQALKKQLKYSNEEKEWESTMIVGQISGGKATNMIPDSTELALDFRFTNTKHMNKILEAVSLICQKNNASYEVLVQGQHMITPKDNKYIKKIIKIAKQQQVELKFEKSHTASDGRFFTEKNIPVIMFNPVCSNGHIENEWVDINSLYKFYTIVENFLK